MARAALQRLFSLCARSSPSFAVTVRVNAGQKKRSYRRGRIVNQAAQRPPPEEVGKCPCEWRWWRWRWRWRGEGRGGCVIPSDRRIKGDPHPLFLSKWRQKSTAIISLKRRVKGGYCMKLLLKEGHSSEWGGCTPREQRVTDKFSSTYCAAESEKAAYTSGQWCGDGKVVLIGLYCKIRDLWRQKANMFWAEHTLAWSIYQFDIIY